MIRNVHIYFTLIDRMESLIGFRVEYVQRLGHRTHISRYDVKSIDLAFDVKTLRIYLERPKFYCIMNLGQIVSRTPN